MQSNAVYANQIADYVGNLQRFVQGYAVDRPTATAKQDDEVLTLPGPDQRVAATDGAPGDVDGVVAMWQFQCPGSTTWVQHPALAAGAAGASISTVCNGATPALASVSFYLDAWGRLEGDIANEPYERRENARWESLAVNVVGTGIRNCAQLAASGQAQCFSEPFVRYNLTSVGPAWVTDYTEQWHVLGVPTGQIEGAKALVAEQWLDPISNGFAKPYVSAVARTEFQERPLGGEYQIVFQLTPDVQLQNIEQIQVLTRSSYWVRQQ
jgi:hypothetical protein